MVIIRVSDYMVKRVGDWRHWKHLGCLSAALVLGSSLNAQTPPTPDLPGVGILATDPTALAGTSSGAFTLVRSGPATADLAVNLDISGTAVNGTDYTTIPNVATIPAGFLAIDIPVQPTTGLGPTSNKTVVLAVATNAAYRTAEARKAAVTIVSDIYNVAPPTISLTSPADNTAFTLPAAITISADASELNGAIQSVSFFANDMVLGRVTNSPYSLVWTNPHTGTFALFARAVDSFGRSTLSTPVHIKVSELKPSVKFLSPTNGSSFSAKSDITLEADASEPGGTVQSVSFYANGHVLGVVSNAPYSMVWTNVPTGWYSLLAVAADASNHRAYSSPVGIRVGLRPGIASPDRDPR